MQLHLSREEKQTGFFRKKTMYHVKFRLDISDEERHAIDKLGIGDHLFFKRTVDDEGEIDISARVKDALRDKGDEHSTDKAYIAQEWEEAVKTGAKGVATAVRRYLEEGGEKEEVIDL